MGEAGSKTKQENISKDDLEFLLKNTHYNEKDILELYKGFMQDCPDGRLTPTKFLQMYQLFFPQGNADQFCDYVFRCFDIDRNGLIDFKEFMLAIGITSGGSAEEKLKWVFRLYDTDRDGVVEQSEMSNIVFSIYDMVGASSRDELALASEKARNMFKRMDSDSDGLLTETEFLTACMNDKVLAQMLAATMDSIAPVFRKISEFK